MSTNQHVKELERKRYLGGQLELACEQLEIPKSRWTAAKTAYESVGEWLNECEVLRRLKPHVSPQGSVVLETTVKPINSEKFDIDLVCHLLLATDRLDQAWIKAIVGQRLKAYNRGPKCYEHRRCWRLDYGGDSQMHLDITPGVNHTTSRFRDIAVPDRDAKDWKESNPPGYAKLFARIAAKHPLLASEFVKFSAANEARAEVIPLPLQRSLKGILRRAIQLAKRHRSLMFQDTPDIAPISIILTTLAMRAYDGITSSGVVYESEFDVVWDIIRQMPSFIELRDGKTWIVSNDTTEDENFAEKWNKNAQLPEAFYRWHKQASADFEALAAASDTLAFATVFDRMFGQAIGKSVRATEETAISTARQQKTLTFSPTSRLSVGGGIGVASNTFFGT